MRVFLATASCCPDYGGPAFLVTRLAQTLSLRGVEISVWAADGSATTTPLLPATSPIERLSGPITEAMGRARSVDVVHDHGIWLPYHHQLAKLCTSRRIPRLVSIHGMLDPWCFQHKTLKKRIAWLLYQRADLDSATAHHVTSEVELRNLEKLKFRVPANNIPLGVDLPDDTLPRSGGKGRTRRIAAYLGRLHPVKGLPMLIKAWAKIRPEGWELQIAGPDNGGHRAEIQNLVNGYGLTGTISFMGPLHGALKGDFLLNADLFILPSQSESFGLAVAEALSHRLPVLTTTAAPWHILEEEQCGWSVEPTVEGISRGLEQATGQDDNTLAAMGTRGRNWVQAHLEWKQITTQFEDFYGVMVSP